MKKALGVAAMLMGLGALAKLLGPRMQNVDWQQRFDAMPDNAPPKWIFRNITAIRKSTDRILEILEEDRDSARLTEPPPRTVSKSTRPPAGVPAPPSLRRPRTEEG
jgi:hypothetical protein